LQCGKHDGITEMFWTEITEQMEEVVVLEKDGRINFREFERWSDF
jgi:hypothetical protein